MPVIGEFHRKYWRARANPITPAGKKTGWMYPGTQSVVICSSLLWWVPADALRPFWRQLRWVWSMARRLWACRSPERQQDIEEWFARLPALTAEQRAVLARVLAILEGPWWVAARQAVRDCATTPSFHQPEQWVEYSRAIKANPGQAQNVFRHLKVVHLLRGLGDDAGAPLSNPEAHLAAELAYQGLAATGRAELKT